MELAVDLDWEQGLFRAARAVWRRLFQAEPTARSPEAVELESLRGRLEVLGRLIGGEAVQLIAADEVGGVRGTSLLLPRVLDLNRSRADHEALYRLRVCVGAWLIAQDLRAEGLLEHIALVHSAVDALADDLPGLLPLFARARAHELALRPPLDALRGVAHAQELAIRRALLGEAPWADPISVRAFAAELAVPSCWLYGRPIRLEVSPAASSAANGSAPPDPSSSEAEAMAAADLELLAIGDEDVVELPVHVFEKVETLDQWTGGVRPMDGSDELDDHLEALDEVDLKHLIRGGERAHAVLRAEIGLDLELPDVGRIAPDERGIAYPEWDRRRRSYRPAWATVYPSAVPRGTDAWALEADARLRPVRERARHRLRRLQDELRPARRQTDGEELDLDAIVDELVERRAGHGGSERLYERLQRQPLDLAVTLLLDLSLSSDGWVDGRRVLDVAREAILVAGELLDEAGASLRIIAFASQTRNQVRAWDVLRWQEPWEVARGRLGALVPQGYTRIGPAVRHATAELRQRPERRRVMVLLSDGRPTDYDRYEGRYGVADVRRAVSDARAIGVDVRALALDARTGGDLPAICGAGAWALLSNPDALPDALSNLLLRAMRS